MIVNDQFITTKEDDWIYPVVRMVCNPQFSLYILFDIPRTGLYVGNIIEIAGGLASI